MRVAKWGNSLAVRLPAAIVEALGLEAGDEIEIDAKSSRSFTISRKMTRKEALEELRKFRHTLPADFKFDREEANAR